uniref:MAP kinase-activating death domain protein n=1 Tax=Schistosoma mansoni TaxID=6183 RepID=A0A3Q0KPR4_SCHMA
MSNICPRLIDYFVLVGSRSPGNANSVQSPEILCRFPPTNHKDFPLPTDVSFFCQPEGCINASSSTFPIKSLDNNRDGIKSMTFLFSLTDKDSSKTRYGICTNFFRPVNVKSVSRTTYSNVREDTHFGNVSVNGPVLCSDELNRLNESTQDKSLSSGKLKNANSVYNLTSICLITHYPFATTFARLVQCVYAVLKKLHKLSKLSCVESPDIWDVLTSNITLSCSNPVVESTRQFQLWILRLLSAPAPIPGCTCVYLSVQPQTLGSPLCFALPDQSRLPLIDFPVNLPFEIMGIRKTFRLIMCLLLEQKVVLQSSDYNKLSLTILSLVALLYPLQYMFPVIPLLPACMPDAEQLLLAPTPYLIGVPTTFYTARKIFRMPKDVWLADLDTGELSYPMVVDEIPELPEIESNILISHLRKLLHEFSNSPHIDLDLEDSSKHWSVSVARATALELSKFDPLLYTLTKDSVDVGIRVSMILFFNTNNILGGFTNHIRTLRLFPRPVVAFQYESFMKSRPKPCLFTSMLAKTQAVEYFAESSICALNEAYQRICSGVYSTELIGDKLYWYKNQLQPVDFDCWDKLFDYANVTPTNTSKTNQSSPKLSLANSNLSMLFQAFELAKSIINRRCSGDINTEIDTDSINNDTISLSNDAQTGDYIGMFKTYSDDSDSNHSYETVVSNGKISKEMEDCILVQANKPLPDCLAEFYTPPTELVYSNKSSTRPSLSLENADSTLSNFWSQSTVITSDSSGNIKRNINEPLTNTNTGIQSLGVPNSESGTLTRSSSVSSRRSTNDTLQLVSRLSSSIFVGNGNDSKKSSTVTSSTFGDDNLSWDTSVTLLFGDLLKSNRLRSLTFKDVPLSALQMHKKRLENERTIIDLSKSIKQGRIPNIFSRNQINTLLQDENYRNLLIARINDNLSKDILPNQLHINNVPIQQWDQYKAILWTLKQMINGLEYSFRPDIVFPTTNHYDRIARDKSPSSNISNPLSNSSWLPYSTGILKSGGFASAFMLMEVAHTHFYRLPNRTGHTDNNHDEKFFWNSMPTTPTTELRSPIPSRKFVGNGFSSVRYQNNRLDLSDCESYSRDGSKLVSNSSSIPFYGYSIDSSVLQQPYSITSPTKHYPHPPHHHGGHHQNNHYCPAKKQQQNISSFNHSQSLDANNIPPDYTNHPLTKPFHVLENTFELTNVSNKLILFKTKVDYSSQHLTNIYSSISSKLLKNLKQPHYFSKLSNNHNDDNDSTLTSLSTINDQFDHGVDDGTTDVLLQEHQAVVTDSYPSPTIPYINSPFIIRGIHITHHSKTLDHNLFHGRGRHPFTSVVVTMSEPSSDREDNEKIQSKPVFKSDSTDVIKQNLQPLNNANDTIGVNHTGSCITVNRHNDCGKFDKLFASDAKLHESTSKLKSHRDFENEGNDINNIPPDYVPELPNRKSQRSFGYRYYQSHLILTDPSIISNSSNDADDQTTCTIFTSSPNTCTPPAVYRPDLKFHFNDTESENEDIDDRNQQQREIEEQRKQSECHMCKLTLLMPTPPPPDSSSVMTVSPSKMKKVPWTYLFEDIFDTELRKSKILGNLQFWEDSFLDTVAQERDILGMDYRPKELLLKYQNSSLLKRKQMELEEDCLLVNIMHNMIAFMLMANVDRISIRKKLQRLLAKSHTGLHYSRKINDLLNSLNYLNGNDIDLNVAQSRFIVQRSHEAYRGSDESGELIFLEVCSDYLLIRNLSGRILERLWYDQVINLTYRSNTHILCITRQIYDHSQMDLFYTRKSRLVYQQIKESMKNISVEASHGILNGDLNGEINATNLDNNQPGTISILPDGFVIKFGDEQKFIKLHNIKRCCTIKSEIFTIDVYDQEKKAMITYRFQTDMALIMLSLWKSIIELALQSN